MERKLKYTKFPFENEYPNEVNTGESLTIPDQALSVRELLERCVRENKPLPKPVDYDMDAIVQEYGDLIVPEHLSKEDALHLIKLTGAHVQKLEYRLRELQTEEHQAQAQPKLANESETSA